MAANISSGRRLATTAKILRESLYTDHEDFIKAASSPVPLPVKYQRIESDRALPWVEMPDDSLKMISAFGDGTFDDFSQSSEISIYISQLIGMYIFEYM